MGQLAYCPKCGKLTVHEPYLVKGKQLLRHDDPMWACVDCGSYGAIARVQEMGKLVRE